MKKFLKTLSVLLLISALLVGCSSTSTNSTDSGEETTETTTVDGNTWAKTYDALISKSKAESDPTARFELLHEAENLLMSTGAITPIYYYVNNFMASKRITNFYASPLGYRIFTYALVDGKPGGTIVACLASEPDTLDPAKNTTVDGATYAASVYGGLLGYQDDDGLFILTADLAAEIPEAVKNDDGTVTYEFKLRDGLKWSDDSDFKASEFVYSWNRAVSPDTAADYAYLFEVVDGYEDAIAGKGELNISADDEANTFTVTLIADTPYFFDLTAFPTFAPVKQSSVEANEEAWANDPATAISMGAYKLESKETGKQITFVKNENYWNAENVTVEKLNFALSDDDNAILSNFKTGDYMFIGSFPINEINTLKANYPDEFFTVPYIGTYYISWNVNAPEFEDFDETQREDIRLALGLLLDRNHIVNNITMGGQNPANSFVPDGISDYNGTQFTAHNGINGDGSGYFSVDEADYAENAATAVEMLKAVADDSGLFSYTESGDTVMFFEGFPELIYLTNNTTGHIAIAEYIQSVWGSYGITINIESQEWATFLDNRKAGNYSVARNGWIADYDDPISFLDMWVTSSGNNDAQFGKGTHGQYTGY
ncbi:MAG: peptide ABC transporter substrate-binding protein [Erysipelotrichaceae bacterium]|nr:peptide ABC transporter substrate-binding protein [Erysipelotrichaceae bacterium]